MLTSRDAAGSPGLTEFTDSESKLSRLVRITSMAVDQPRPFATLVRLSKAQIALNNISVVDRHVRLARRLRLLEKSNDRFRATDRAKALLKLDGPPSSSESLSQYDKVFFTQALLQEAPVQLLILMKAIEHEQGRPWGSVVIEYFKHYEYLPWKHQTIVRSLSSYEMSGHVPRLLEHKVSAMAGWLRDLGLTAPRGPPRLTQSGDMLLSHWSMDRHTLDLEPLQAARIVCGIAQAKEFTIRPFDTSIIERATEILRTSPAPFGMVSYEYARFRVTCSLLVESGIVLNENIFRALVDDLWKKGVVRSILMGREGKPEAITLDQG